MAIGEITRIGSELVQTEGRDGPDYQRICITHRWASRGSVSINTVPECPFCRVELDEHQGRQRFDDLQRLMTATYAPPTTETKDGSDTAAAGTHTHAR